MEIFLELTTIVFVATIVSIVMRLLKQPLIVGYILSGILVGPYFLNEWHRRYKHHQQDSPYPIARI